MVSVNDPDYLLLALSCVAVVVVLLAAKFRESEFLVHVILCGELGLVILFLWNTSVPASLVVSNPFYFVLAAFGCGLLVLFVWHTLGTSVVFIVLVGAAIWLLVAGRDTVSGWFGGISDYGLAALFVVFMGVVLALVWWIRTWTRVWRLVGVVCMGMGLALAVDVIYQEINSGNQNLDLVDFTGNNEFLYCIAGSEVVTVLLYYRHLIFPCWFKKQKKPPSPSAHPKAKKKPLMSYYSGLPLSDSEEEESLPPPQPSPPVL
jgi:hypothetical protein